MNAVPPFVVHDAAVLGAGASGLMCAMTAAARGLRVLLIEQSAGPGRKLSITGGGKCNLTNRTVSSTDYVGENPDFVRSALARFTPARLQALMFEAGIALEEREHGQLFCVRSARDVVAFFASRCKEHGCRLAVEEKILSAALCSDQRERDRGARFLVRTTTALHRARNLVVATGGPAWPQVGGTGSGYECARAFGHRIIPIRPALVPLVMPTDWPLAGLTGIAVPAGIRVLPPELAPELPPELPPRLPPELPKTGRRPAPHRRKAPPDGCEREIIAAENLPLLFTHKGISGPAALQASLYWRKGRALRIDFLPALSLPAMLQAPGAGRVLLRNLLRRHLPDRLCAALLPQRLGDKKTAELSRAEREELQMLLCAHTVSPTGTEGFAKAEVTAGGVDTATVSSRDMQSKLVPGLFFCGEVLDVAGRLGGYNLHWAFASGQAAGEGLQQR